MPISGPTKWTGPKSDSETPCSMPPASGSRNFPITLDKLPRHAASAFLIQGRWRGADGGGARADRPERWRLVVARAEGRPQWAAAPQAGLAESAHRARVRQVAAIEVLVAQLRREARNREQGLRERAELGCRATPEIVLGSRDERPTLLPATGSLVDSRREERVELRPVRRVKRNSLPWSGRRMAGWPASPMPRFWAGRSRRRRWSS